MSNVWSRKSVHWTTLSPTWGSRYMSVQMNVHKFAKSFVIWLISLFNFDFEFSHRIENSFTSSSKHGKCIAGLLKQRAEFVESKLKNKTLIPYCSFWYLGLRNAWSWTRHVVCQWHCTSNMRDFWDHRRSGRRLFLIAITLEIENILCYSWLEFWKIFENWKLLILLKNANLLL